MLGWPLKVTISGATGFTWKFFWVGKENLTPQPVPAALDYDLWLGPAPYKPYNVHRTHQTFRGYWDYDGGGLGDMGQHYMDPVQYLLGKDNTSPVKVEGDAPQQHPDAIGIWRKIVYTYEDGCQIVLEGEGYETPGQGSLYRGPEGQGVQGIRMHDSRCHEQARRAARSRTAEHRLHPVRPQPRTFRPGRGQIGYHSATLVNMALCALRLNRTLQFDPEKQLFVNDDAANRLIDQPMRAPWKNLIRNVQNMHIMKKLLIILLACCLVPFATQAQDARQRTATTIIADALAQLPAETPMSTIRSCGARLDGRFRASANWPACSFLPPRERTHTSNTP